MMLHTDSMMGHKDPRSLLSGHAQLSIATMGLPDSMMAAC